MDSIRVSEAPDPGSIPGEATEDVKHAMRREKTEPLRGITGRGFIVFDAYSEVAAEIGLKPARYNKMEKGLVEFSIDNIVHLDKDIPKAVQIEDKTSAEQLHLIAHINEKTNPPS